MPAGFLNPKTHQVPNLPHCLQNKTQAPKAPLSMIWSLSCTVSCHSSPSPPLCHPPCPSVSFCLPMLLDSWRCLQAPSGTAHISQPAWMPFSHRSASQIALPPPKPRSSVTSAEKPFPKPSVGIKGALFCGQIASRLCLH